MIRLAHASNSVPFQQPRLPLKPRLCNRCSRLGYGDRHKQKTWQLGPFARSHLACGANVMLPSHRRVHFWVLGAPSSASPIDQVGQVSGPWLLRLGMPGRHRKILSLLDPKSTASHVISSVECYFCDPHALLLLEWWHAATRPSANFAFTSLDWSRPSLTALSILLLFSLPS